MQTLLCLMAASVAFAQPPAFEVASIKPAPPPETGAMRTLVNGGPGTKDPGRWTCENMNLSTLVLMAYHMQRYQLSAPSWLDAERFNIVAKVPAGATKDDFRVMLQNLLAERFALKLHREKKEMPMYELTVAKSGPKLHGSPPLQEGETGEPPRIETRPKITMGADGFPVLPPGLAMTISLNGKTKMRTLRQTMETFAGTLAGYIGKPVTDATALTGTYDIELAWIQESAVAMAPRPAPDGAAPIAAEPAGPTLFAALQEQLGLKLESKKGTAEIFVVDHIERVPSDN